MWNDLQLTAASEGMDAQVEGAIQPAVFSESFSEGDVVKRICRHRHRTGGDTQDELEMFPDVSWPIISGRNDMQQVAYDPDAYGWSGFSRAQKELTRETVYDQVRKAHVIYYASSKTPTPIPALTSDDLTQSEFVNRSLQIIQAFGGVRKGVRLVASYVKMPYAMPLFTLTFDDDGRAHYTSQAIFSATVLNNGETERMVKHFDRLQVGTGEQQLSVNTQGGRLAFVAERFSHNDFKVKTLFRTRTGGVFEATRPDIESILRVKLSHMMRHLFKDLPPDGFIPEGDIEMITLDVETARLPKLEAAPVTALSNDELIKEFGQASVEDGGRRKGKGKGKKASPTTPGLPRKQPARQAFVAPARVAVPRKRTGEMLDMLGYRGAREYKNVCPARGDEPIRATYERAYSAQPGDGLDQIRDKRNRAIVCALLRQRVQAAFADADPGHKKPVSLAYALATAASRRVVGDQAATADNKLIDSWLGLKRALILPEDVP